MNITPHTRRYIVGGMSIIGTVVAIGWVIGAIETKDALLVIMPLFTGFFSLLKGEE